MKTLLKFIKEHKYCLILIYWPIHTLWYEILRMAYMDKEVLIFHSKLDDIIPFCEYFIVPYVLWYVYIAAVLLYSLFSSKREFLRASSIMILSMILPMIFCTIIPNGIPITMRPDFETLGRDNIFIWAVKQIYSADSPPLNVFPSMHVSVSIGMFFAVLKSESLKGKHLIHYFAGLLSIFISLSTVFIKQHSVLDVFAGVLTAIVVYIGVEIFEKKFFNKKQNT